MKFYDLLYWLGEHVGYITTLNVVTYSFFTYFCRVTLSMALEWYLSFVEMCGSTLKVVEWICWSFYNLEV